MTAPGSDLHPSTEAVFRSFAATCAARVWPARTQAWVAVTLLSGPRPCQVELLLEGPDGSVHESVTLRFPATPALAEALADPLTEVAWAEVPARADRLWARFATGVGSHLLPFSPTPSG